MNDVNTTELKEILNSTKIPTINLTTKEVKKVDGINGTKILTISDYKGSGKTKEYRRQFVEDLIGFDFANYFNITKAHQERKNKFKKNSKYKPKKELDSIPELPKIQHKTIWNARIQQYVNGKIVLAEKKDITTKTCMYIPGWLATEALKRNRYDDLLSFVSGIPSTPKSKSTIEDLLELIKNHLDDFFYYLAKYQRIEEWVWDSNQFWQSVNNLDFKGAGASEILAVLLFKGASMMGGNVSYDLLIQNDAYPEGLRIELKSDITSYGSFRISKSSIASFDIFNKVCDLCIGIMRTFNEHSHKEIKERISNEEFISLKKMVIDYDEEISLYNQWRSVVEFNEYRLRQLQLFLYYFHDVTQREFMFYHIKDHEYIINPKNLFKDLNNVIYTYFENHNIDQFVFVRNGEILLLNKEDISFGEITAGNVKIIEKSRSKRRELYDENIAFDIWKKDKNNTYAVTYNKYQEN